MAATFQEILHRWEQGRPRREAIRRHFEENPFYQLEVDGVHTRQVKRDKDLTKLLKAGFLRKVRINDKGRCRKSHLIRAVNRPVSSERNAPIWTKRGYN
jgi:hypothetical protein